MKRKAISLIVLVLILGILAAVYLVMPKSGDTSDTAETSEKEASVKLFDFSADDITKLSFSSGEDNLSFSLSGGKWSYDGDSEFPLAESNIEEMKSAVTESEIKETLKDAEDLASYGLDNPSKTVVITANGNEQKITFGSFNNFADGYYLMLDGKIHIVSSSLYTPFDKELYDLLTKTSPADVAAEDITLMKINDEEITGESLDGLKEAFASLKEGDVAAYKDKEALGFDGSEIKVYVEYKATTVDSEGNSAESQKGETISLVVGDDASYMMLPGDDLVYFAEGAEAFRIIE